MMDEQSLFLEMMKQHISSGLNFSCPTTQSTSDGETSEHESLPTPIVYKKRARIKFSQEQLDILEATFQQHRYPTIDMVDDLVEQLNLPTQKITVWFQNRRARLKKSQQKPDDQSTFEQTDFHPPHYDSGIQLDDEGSRDSVTSPPMPSAEIYPSMNYFPPSPYYLPPHHQTSFYNPMWQNFQYPMSTNSFTGHPSYPMMNYNGSFLLHETPNHYSHPTEFYN